MHIPTVKLILSELDILERRYRDALAGEPGESLLQEASIIIDKETWKMTRAQRYAALIDSFSRMREALSGLASDVDMFLDKGANVNVKH